MDAQPHLGADLQVRQLDEHVERVGDPAVGRVLQRHQAELDVAAIDLLEDRRDRADRHVLDRLAKFGDRGQVAVAVLRARGRRHADRALERPRAAHQLAEDDPQASPAGSGPWLAARAWAITSSSRAADQTSSPWSCLSWPICDDDLGAAIQQARRGSDRAGRSRPAGSRDVGCRFESAAFESRARSFGARDG